MNITSFSKFRWNFFAKSRKIQAKYSGYLLLVKPSKTLKNNKKLNKNGLKLPDLKQVVFRVVAFNYDCYWVRNRFLEHILWIKTIIVFHVEVLSNTRYNSFRLFYKLRWFITKEKNFIPNNDSFFYFFFASFKSTLFTTPITHRLIFHFSKVFSNKNPKSKNFIYFIFDCKWNKNKKKGKIKLNFSSFSLNIMTGSYFH